MKNKTAHTLRQQIQTQNIFSFAKYKKMRLLVYLGTELHHHLAPALNRHRNCQITYVQNASDLNTKIKDTPFDALVYDLSTDIDRQLDQIATLTSDGLSFPIIAIADDFDPEQVNVIFDAGVEDMVSLDELTSKQLLRAVGYAVVRRTNLEKVHAFEKRHQGIIQNASEGIFQTTPQGSYILANPALAKLYGYDTPEEMADDLTNIAIQLYVDPDRRKEFVDLLYTNDEVRNFESQIKRKDGTIIWISESARAVRDEQDHLLYFEGFVRDITNRKDNEKKLKYLAQRDPLTGLPNRAFFQEKLAEAITNSDNAESRTAILFIDLDNFKNINDSMGHPVGDEVLCHVADRLLSSTKESDTVSRLGGDEFTVILNNINGLDVAAQVAARILETLSTPYEVNERLIYSSASIGVSIYPDNGKTIEELMQNVDVAAYHAKKEGRNTYQFFTDNLSTEAIRHLEIENGLRTALENNEFHLLYQPKINLKNNKIIGSEALIRWESKELGSVSPMEFIPIAEETGLILPIGDWVIKEACSQTRQWLDLGLDPGTISVNLSAKQFHQKGLYMIINDIIQETKIPPQRLEIELTESAFVKNVDEAIEILKHIESTGIKTAIDDFGTGYSSLSYLKRFPVSTLKIDRSFIMELPDNPEDVAITRAIISLAQSLNMKVVAEGVENASQCAFLNSLDCEYGQGYFFDRPLSATAFKSALMN